MFKLSIWKDQQYENKNCITIDCFWCGASLGRHLATVDHILSGPILRNYGLVDDCTYWCISCIICNTRRSYITSLYRQSKRKTNRWLSRRGRHSWDMRFFYSKIKEKESLKLLDPKICEMALSEIDTVRNLI